MDDMLAADAGHEAGHAVDKDNLNKGIRNQKLGTNYDIESKPDKAESNILMQSAFPIILNWIKNVF